MAGRSLVEEAEADYLLLKGERTGPRVIKLRTGDFDFLTSEEMPTVPIHVVEARREEQLRNGVVDQDASLCDFVKAMGIDEAETEDPVSGRSALHKKDSTRAYFGEQDGEAYRMFRKNMIRYAEDEEWLKRAKFLEGQVADDYMRQRYVDNGGKPPADAEAVASPVTSYKAAFFARGASKSRA